jgi:hypothetical protein
MLLLIVFLKCSCFPRTDFYVWYSWYAVKKYCSTLEASVNQYYYGFTRDSTMSLRHCTTVLCWLHCTVPALLVYWCSGPVDTLLFLYCCACCLYPNVQQYTNCGTLLYQFMGRLLLFLLMLYIYCCSCLYFLPFTLAHFIYLLCFSYLEACNKCHASQFVVFWMNNYFFLLVCFDWVCKTICHLESSIRSPARGSHWSEWIKPGWSTGIGSVCQLSVCMLESCIHTSKLQDYSNSTQHVGISIIANRVIGVVVLWLWCICSMMMY